jgi:hypothetical protein
MVKVLFTLDYEIHGNGEGSPLKLMVEPTYRMLKLFDKFGAKLTILADVAEILKFREYYQNYGKDTYSYLEIAEQLKFAIKSGHDVQLHIHSSYFNATHNDGKWNNDWSEYDLANLPFERVDKMIRLSKQFLNDLLKQVKVNYSCNVFRAANWSLMPSKNIIRSLTKNGIKIDTSVFKYGKRKGLVNFDYSDCYSDALPWIAHDDDITKQDITGNIIEVPIYSQLKPIWSFFSLNRLYRVKESKNHNFNEGISYYREVNGFKSPKMNKTKKMIKKLFTKHALKADFNQCTGKQLINQLKKVEKDYAHLEEEIPFVTIGHSKLYTPYNEKSLLPFLKYVSEHSEQYKFTTFQDFQFKGLDFGRKSFSQPKDSI